MVRHLMLAAFLAGGVPALASASTGGSEVGYPSGSLAVQSIVSGDYAGAERVLAPVSREDATDPARLINIGVVYAKTGRLAEAQEAFRAARMAPDAPLMLSNDREVSSQALAANLLKSLDARYASR